MVQVQPTAVTVQWFGRLNTCVWGSITCGLGQLCRMSTWAMQGAGLFFGGPERGLCVCVVDRVVLALRLGSKPSPCLQALLRAAVLAPGCGGVPCMSSHPPQQPSAGARGQQRGSLPALATHTTAAVTWFGFRVCIQPTGRRVHDQTDTRLLSCRVHRLPTMQCSHKPHPPTALSMPPLTMLCCHTHTHPGPVFSLCLSCPPKSQQTRTSRGRSTACWSNSKSE